jgi:DnaA family protein
MGHPAGIRREIAKMSQQRVIPISVADDTSLESFYSARNQPLIAELKRLLAGERVRRVLYLWGDSGSGKTHLLDACCSATQIAATKSLYVSLKQGFEEFGKLREVDDDTLVCIDDLEQIAGSEEAQNIILSLYEKITIGTGAIVASGTGPLSSMGLELKDLESRLSSGGTFNIYALDDDEKRKALKLRASKRGFTLDDNVIEFIMSHYRRDTKSLFALLDKMDSASLQAQRKITVPFVKRLL